MTQRQALEILKTGANVFLTGEPGSGKTHTIRQYIAYLKEAGVDIAVTASTGIAATHISGFTIHSWSGIGIKKTLSPYDVDRLATNERLVRRIARTRVLIIDEISMLDAATLESVSIICQAIKQSEEPFGGMQVVLVGDFFQLPPVSREGEDPARFAFASPLWTQANFLVCYLSEQHRQEDVAFLEMLCALRKNAVEDKHRQYLDQRCQAPLEDSAQPITRLFSHNMDVDRMNNEELAKVEGPSKVFRMAVTGKQPLIEQLKRGCLSPEALVLKEGAIVMFTKNSPKGAFVNGTLGKVIEFNQYTKCPVVETVDKRLIPVEPMDWNVEDNGRVLARITQLPLRLAWAMTVHKSQGMSLDAAWVDLRGAFVAGQGYVALSRVRSLQGLFLAGYNNQALQVHPQVQGYDEQLREHSRLAADTFAKLPAGELRQMHHNFIRFAGGKVRKLRSSAEKVEKAYSVDVIRAKYPNAYRSWRKEEIAMLAVYRQKGMNIKKISELLGRQPGAIRSRLQKIKMEKT